MRRLVAFIARITCAVAIRAPVAAPEFPSRPLTLVVPFAAGGATGLIARMMLPRMSEVLGQRSPVLALSMLLFLLSLGGIPFVAGFWAKLYVFWAAAQQGLYWLVLLGAILTVVALFYYLLVAKRMYIDPPQTMAPVTAPFLLNFSIFLCVAGVVGFGVYPKPLVMAALRAASSLF